MATKTTVMAMAERGDDGLWEVGVEPQALDGEDFTFLGDVDHLPAISLPLRAGGVVAGYAFSDRIAYVVPPAWVPKPDEAA